MDAIYQELSAFQGGVERFDDETVIVLKVLNPARIRIKELGVQHLADTLIEKTTERTIHPARNLFGTLRLPGDKSISHRYALLAALAEGVSRFHNFSTGADCASSLDCVRQLGAKVTRSGDTVEVEGCAGR